MALKLMNTLPKQRSLSSITIYFYNATRFAVSVNEDQERFRHSIGYLNCTNHHIKFDLLLILADARLPNYQNCYTLVLLLSKIMMFIIVKKSIKGPVKILIWSIKNSCEVLIKLTS